MKLALEEKDRNDLFNKAQEIYYLANSVTCLALDATADLRKLEARVVELERERADALARVEELNNVLAYYERFTVKPTAAPEHEPHGNE